MTFPLIPKYIECPECEFRGKSTIKGSDSGLFAAFIVLLIAYFFFLFWPLFILSLAVLFWLLIKRADRVCPRCRFEIPGSK